MVQLRIVSSSSFTSFKMAWQKKKKKGRREALHATSFRSPRLTLVLSRELPLLPKRYQIRCAVRPLHCSHMLAIIPPLHHSSLGRDRAPVVLTSLLNFSFSPSHLHSRLLLSPTHRPAIYPGATLAQFQARPLFHNPEVMKKIRMLCSRATVLVFFSLLIDQLPAKGAQRSSVDVF